MGTITISDRCIFERVSNGCFPEKINAKSLVSANKKKKPELPRQGVMSSQTNRWTHFYSVALLRLKLLKSTL